MHKLLQRQLRRCVAGLEPTSEEWNAFLQRVDEAYAQADADRALLERSLELSSQELTQMNESLRKDLADRKRLEKAILQSEKMSAVGQLAAGIAHEINNPLGVILGFAQAAIRRLGPSDSLELPIRSIEREAVRCKNLVQDLLTFSRASKIDREPTDLNRAVESALSLVRVKAKMMPVKIHLDLAPSLPRFLGNPGQVQQVIINLSTNALDAMETGGKLTVKTEALKEGPLNWVCLKVSDTLFDRVQAP